jgi:hypothetical protein
LTISPSPTFLGVAGGIIDLITDSSVHPEQAMRWLMVTLEFAALLSMARRVWFFVSLLTVDEVDRTPSAKT